MSDGPDDRAIRAFPVAMITGRDLEAFDALPGETPLGPCAAERQAWEEYYSTLWRELTGFDAPAPPDRRGLCAHVVQEFGCEIGSPLHSLASILTLLPAVQAARDRGDLEAVELTSFMLGHHLAEINIMIGSHDVVELGAKLAPKFAAGRADANAARGAAAAREHHRWVATARAVWKRNPRLSVSSCARIVIKDLGLSAKLKTVADVIRSLKKVGEAR